MRDRKPKNRPTLAPTWPGALAGFRCGVIYAATEAEREDIRFRLASLSSQPKMVAMMRRIVNLLRLYVYCPRAMCRRASACRTPYVTCVMENRQTAIELFRDLYEWRLACDADSDAPPPGMDDGGPAG